MAEVLSPLASTNSMSMLRSPQDAFQASSNQGARMQRNSMYNPQLSAAMAYRAQNQNQASYNTYQTQQNQQTRKQDRRKSAGAVLGPTMKHSFQQPLPPYHESSSSAASSTSSSSNQSGVYAASKDDSVLGYHEHGSTKNRLSMNMAASMSTPDLSASSNQFARPSPDRYRRVSKQMDVLPSMEQSDAQRARRPMSAPIPAYSAPMPAPANSIQNPPSPLRRSETDDSNAGTTSNTNRYKRRSVAAMGAAPVYAQRSASSPAIINGPSWSQVVSGKHVYQGTLPPPAQQSRPAHHVRTNSGELRSQGIRPTSSRHSSYVSTQSNTARPTTAPNNPFPRPRSSLGAPVSSAVSMPKRPATAGGPAKLEDHASSTSRTDARNGKDESQSTQSPAVQQLSALNNKSNQKGVKSRIRRAFSFSSSSELRKATAENNLAAERAKVRKERFEGDSIETDGLIAAEQEANGLGNNIYSGQGQFAGSTDNLSMASTASSASMMLRSIGRGMKKSSRNLRGLFRPKSMIASSASTTELDQAISQVTLVNIEAEREAVNVNIDPHDVPGGGTGFPKLERNSIDQMSDAQSIGYGGRPSMVASERERAEVLAAVRKGILKRSDTSSTSSSPVLPQGERPQLVLPTQHSAPGSPSTAGMDAADSYFTGQTNSASTRSLPVQSSRNVSFGQRVQFFDVWSPAEYDRRGDIATCNRLTPMLAQQIKEELNTFKMEMEVHELSKPHTHFF